MNTFLKGGKRIMATVSLTLATIPNSEAAYLPLSVRLTSSSA